MAYYPPTPSFGLPFSLAQQRQAPISSSNPSHNFVGDAFSITSDMEQPTTVPPYSSERDYVNQKTSPVSSSTTNPPTLNTSSAFKAFQQNSALPEVNHHAFGHGGPPPLPMFGQFGNGSLPPPPYPPIPIPQNGFTAYPPPILTGNEYQSLVPLAPPPPGSTRPSSRALNINAPNSSLSHKHLSVGPDREEGELSDAELGQPLSVEAESLRRNESATGNRKQPTNGHNSRGAYSDHIDTSGDKRRESKYCLFSRLHCSFELELRVYI